MGDNPKYIALELLEQDKKYDLVWLTSKKEVFPDEIRSVPIYSIRALLEMATAKVWVDNFRKPAYISKRKNQYYIQTWHGGIGLKKAEKDALQSLGKEYENIAKRDSDMIDVFISNGTLRTNLYRTSYWYDGEILECGFPRNDRLVCPKGINQSVREQLQINEDTKVILYAPTFRDNHDMSCYLAEFEQVVTTFEQKYGGNWMMLLRFHPHVDSSKIKVRNRNQVIMATDYPDITELLQITDVLISDFSSLIFDYALKKKPIFLYATDYEKYVQNRGMRYTYDTLPFPYGFCINQLIEQINDFQEETYQVELETFMKTLLLHETGHASEQIASLIHHITYEKMDFQTAIEQVGKR